MQVSKDAPVRSIPLSGCALISIMSLSDDDGRTSRRLRWRQVVSGFENFADNSGHVMQYRLAYLQDDAEGEPSSSFVLSGELTSSDMNT